MWNARTTSLEKSLRLTANLPMSSGFPAAFPNPYAQSMMERLCTHPNVGAVVLVSLGCESFDRYQLEQVVKDSGRPVGNAGHSARTEARGPRLKAGAPQSPPWQTRLRKLRRFPSNWQTSSSERFCGGSDGTSGLTGNPAVGRTFDMLVESGATCIFEETGELIGCEDIMGARAATPELGAEIRASVDKAAAYYATLGFGSFAAGNAEGGLTTIEEKSLGAYAKSGQSQISGLIKPGDIPLRGGLYLMDVVPDGEGAVRFPEHLRQRRDR